MLGGGASELECKRGRSRATEEGGGEGNSQISSSLRPRSLDSVKTQSLVVFVVYKGGNSVRASSPKGG